MVSAAEELRRAASALRELAGAATPGPWAQGAVGDRLINEVDYLGAFGHVTASPDRSDDGRGGVSDAAYIATMHPAVGLALADWLEEAADYWNLGVFNDAALPVARAINGADQ